MTSQKQFNPTSDSSRAPHDQRLRRLTILIFCVIASLVYFGFLNQTSTAELVLRLRIKFAESWALKKLATNGDDGAERLFRVLFAPSSQSPRIQSNTSTTAIYYLNQSNCQLIVQRLNKDTRFFDLYEQLCEFDQYYFHRDQTMARNLTLYEKYCHDSRGNVVLEPVISRLSSPLRAPVDEQLRLRLIRQLRDLFTAERVYDYSLGADFVFRSEEFGLKHPVVEQLLLGPTFANSLDADVFLLEMLANQLPEPLFSNANKQSADLDPVTIENRIAHHSTLNSIAQRLLSHPRVKIAAQRTLLLERSEWEDKDRIPFNKIRQKLICRLGLANAETVNFLTECFKATRRRTRTRKFRADSIDTVNTIGLFYEHLGLLDFIAQAKNVNFRQDPKFQRHVKAIAELSQVVALDNCERLTDKLLRHSSKFSEFEFGTCLTLNLNGDSIQNLRSKFVDRGQIALTRFIAQRANDLNSNVVYRPKLSAQEWRYHEDYFTVKSKFEPNIESNYDARAKHLSHLACLILTNASMNYDRIKLAQIIAQFPKTESARYFASLALASREIIEASSSPNQEPLTKKIDRLNISLDLERFIELPPAHISASIHSQLVIFQALEIASSHGLSISPIQLGQILEKLNHSQVSHSQANQPFSDKLIGLPAKIALLKQLKNMNCPDVAINKCLIKDTYKYHVAGIDWESWRVPNPLLQQAIDSNYQFGLDYVVWITETHGVPKRLLARINQKNSERKALVQ